MAKFINIDHETVINISEIQTIERVLFDLEKADFTRTEVDTGKEIVFEYDSVTLAYIHFKNGEVRKILTGIYFDEEDTSEEWALINQINRNWERLIDTLDCKLVDL